MKHITPLKQDEPTDAELARRPDHRKDKRDPADPAMRKPTPEQIRSAH